jgi:hypothetical protein
VDSTIKQENFKGFVTGVQQDGIITGGVVKKPDHRGKINNNFV